jgi:hypothetical protein
MQPAHPWNPPGLPQQQVGAARPLFCSTCMVPLLGAQAWHVLLWGSAGLACTAVGERRPGMYCCGGAQAWHVLLWGSAGLASPAVGERRPGMYCCGGAQAWRVLLYVGERRPGMYCCGGAQAWRVLLWGSAGLACTAATAMTSHNTFSTAAAAAAMIAAPGCLLAEWCALPYTTPPGRQLPTATGCRVGRAVVFPDQSSSSSSSSSSSNSSSSIAMM